ncbi:MAG: NAD(P)/FAD-dependent oxidoreductase [Phycisphaerales bacterium JB050]
MSNSLWHTRATPLPAETDCVVVGAGIAGISAALALESQNLSILVLDQRYPGWGASGRNAGFLMRGAADNYAAAVRDLGREPAKALWTLTEDNLARLRALGIDRIPEYRAQPSCLVAFDDTEAAELEQSATLLAEDGFAVETRNPSDHARDALWTHAPPLLGLVNPDDAVCDPVELLAWLRAMLQRQPRTETTVLQIHHADGTFSVRTTRGDIRCQHVLLCTNAYTRSLLPNLATTIAPNRGQMLALDASELPAPERLEFAYYANHGSEYFRQPDDKTIIVGGWRKHFASDERTDDNRPSTPVQQGLEDFAARVLGRRLPVVHRWAGTMAFTPDGLPLAGPLVTDDSQSPSNSPWICAGFTGHGMSMAHDLATRTALAMCDPDATDKIPDLFSPSRFANA